MAEELTKIVYKVEVEGQDEAARQLDGIRERFAQLAEQEKEFRQGAARGGGFSIDRIKNYGKMLSELTKYGRIQSLIKLKATINGLTSSFRELSESIREFLSLMSQTDQAARTTLPKTEVKLSALRPPGTDWSAYPGGAPTTPAKHVGYEPPTTYPFGPDPKYYFVKPETEKPPAIPQYEYEPKTTTDKDGTEKKAVRDAHVAALGNSRVIAGYTKMWADTIADAARSPNPREAFGEIAMDVVTDIGTSAIGAGLGTILSPAGQGASGGGGEQFTQLFLKLLGIASGLPIFQDTGHIPSTAPSSGIPALVHPGEYIVKESQLHALQAGLGIAGGKGRYGYNVPPAAPPVVEVHLHPGVDAEVKTALRARTGERILQSLEA